MAPRSKAPSRQGSMAIASDGSVCEELERLEKAMDGTEGLVFDCDGTLLDTMPIYFESWTRTCDEIGLSFPMERFYSFAGVPVEDIFQILIEEQWGDGEGKPTAQYCSSVKRRHHKAVEQEGMIAGPVEAVVELVHRYHGKLPMAVASSGWRDHVCAGLERIGILHKFDAVVTSDDEQVKLPKPAPDIFLVAAKRINTSPDKCVGFEDADLGIQALESAGYHYSCDVRLMHMYPRNVERRNSEAETTD